MPKFNSCHSCGDTVTTWDNKHDKWDHKHDKWDHKHDKWDHKISKWDDCSSDDSSDDCDRKCDGNGWKNRKWDKCCPEKKRSCCVKAWDYQCKEKCNSCWSRNTGCVTNLSRCLNPEYTWWNDWYPKSRPDCGCKCHPRHWKC